MSTAKLRQACFGNENPLQDQLGKVFLFSGNTFCTPLCNAQIWCSRWVVSCPIGELIPEIGSTRSCPSLNATPYSVALGKGEKDGAKLSGVPTLRHSTDTFHRAVVYQLQGPVATNDAMWGCWPS